MVHHCFTSHCRIPWMSLEIGVVLPFDVQEEEFIIVLELIKEENFIQLCEHTCIVRAVFMPLSLSMKRL